MTFKAHFIGAVALLVSLAAHAQTTNPIDLSKAREAFAEAQEVSESDGGRLWGMPLYGAMFFVDPATRFVVANEPDAKGVLHPDGDLYVGTLPQSILVANSPADWDGKRWTMLMWPLPEDTLTRRISFAHEMFHRIQPALQLEPRDIPNLHLDTAEGRLWLQLEWRALAAALVQKGAAQSQAIRDALAFRLHRRQLFPNAAKAEDSLEIVEGVAEYTGTVVGAPDRNAGRWRAVARLADPDQSITFVRAFAYVSGPAYGILLDERLPGWRKKLNAQSDLGALLASTLHGSVADTAEQRAPLYGGSGIRMAEADRTTKAEAKKARYRALLIDGPTLTLPGTKLRFSFNPSTLIALGDVGSVYPTFHAEGAWGTLDVTDGVLMPTDFSRLILAAPKDTAGSHLSGPGWTLDLLPGWHLVPASKVGSYTVQKE